MGQRHQVYLVLPTTCNETLVLGFHHQWCYGYTAVRLLGRFLAMLANRYADINWLRQPCKTDSDIIEVIQRVFEACWSIDPDYDGYYHQVYRFKNTLQSNKEETSDPNNGDNNDGITIIDLRNYYEKDSDDCHVKGIKNVKYAFMSIGHTEGRYSLLTHHPVDAETYLRSYYPEFKWKYDGELSKEDVNNCKRYLKMVTKHKLQVMTREEIQSAFPKMKLEDISVTVQTPEEYYRDMELAAIEEIKKRIEVKKGA